MKNMLNHLKIYSSFYVHFMNIYFTFFFIFCDFFFIFTPNKFFLLKKIKIKSYLIYFSIFLTN